MTPAPNPSPVPAMAALRSLRVRLLLATLVGAALALALAWLGLSSLFRDHVQQQFQISLTQQLDQLTARFSLDDQGQPVIDTQGMTDPRWQQPLSGLYWQVDTVAADGRRQAATLRSRSLWTPACRPPAMRCPMAPCTCMSWQARRATSCCWSARCVLSQPMQSSMHPVGG